MSKKRRQPVSPWSLGSVPLTPVENKSGYESSAELWNRLQQEEREAQAASERQKYLASPEGQLDTAVAENEKLLKKFWSLPFSELKEFESRHFPVDVLGDYTQIAADDTPDKDRVILGDFLDELRAQGVDFPEDGDGLRSGLLRFMKYFTSLRQHHRVGMTQANLLQALQRLVYGLQAFPAGELSGTVQAPEWAVTKPQAAPQETENQRRARIEAEIENIPTDTREGRAKATAVLDGLWGADVANRYREFADFMDKTYGVDVLTDKICREYGSFCDRFNLNPIAATTLNAWRSELDSRGYFAGSLLTPDEKIAASLERSDLNDREVRRNVARRIYEANPTR